MKKKKNKEDKTIDQSTQKYIDRQAYITALNVLTGLGILTEFQRLQKLSEYDKRNK